MHYTYRICEECGITYTPSHIFQKYCHNKCYRRAADRRRRSKPQSANWVEVNTAPRTEPEQRNLPLPDTTPTATPTRESMNDAIGDMYNTKDLRRLAEIEQSATATDKKDKDNAKE